MPYEASYDGQPLSKALGQAGFSPFSEVRQRAAQDRNPFSHWFFSFRHFEAHLSNPEAQADPCRREELMPAPARLQPVSLDQCVTHIPFKEQETCAVGGLRSIQ